MATKKSTTATKKKSTTKTNTKNLEKVVEEVKEEEKKELKEKLDNMEDFLKEEKNKPKKHIFVNFLLIILFFVSLGYFGILLFDKDTSIFSLVSNLLLILFSIFFVVVSITYNRNKKGMIGFSTLLLICYFLLGINSHYSFVKTPVTTVPDFSGKTLTEVMKWASKNDITITQEYEYSDMIDEYKIISQDVKKDTNIKNIKEIKVSVSEGANPSKEIVVPSMISWDSERVLKFVKDNYLSNVNVTFVESDKAQNTVIEQSASGNLKRDDELNLTFSYGEELGFSEVNLIDLTGKSKFEVEFYMKQNQLNYEFDEDFDKSIKRGYVKGQKIKAGEVVPINDIVVNVTLSKGPKIKVPDLTKYNMTEITEWAIKNKLKLSFSDKYDDSVKENSIISVNKNKGDIVEQGSVIEVVISRGALKMPKFKNVDAFYEWANKYEINYSEEHEFSETVPVGEVISYSYKKGQAIKNGDTIIVKISDGNKKTVPNLKGLSKSEAIKKLESVGLEYTFIYDSSNTVKKNYVIGQSISSGSEISSTVTITVTLSNGEKESSSTSQRKATVDTNKSNNNNNSTNNNNGGGNNNNTPAPQPTPTPQPDPTPSCNSCTITGLKNVIRDNLNGGYGSVSSALRSSIQSQCPGINVNISADSTSGKAPGSFVSGFSGGSTDSCKTVSITLAN